MLNRTFVSGSTLGAGLALLVAAGTADAAVVTFSSADFTADTQISTDGTAVGAVNGGTVAAGIMKRFAHLTPIP